jgi:hypothetical protein
MPGLTRVAGDSVQPQPETAVGVNRFSATGGQSGMTATQKEIP